MVEGRQPTKWRSVLAGLIASFFLAAAFWLVSLTTTANTKRLDSRDSAPNYPVSKLTVAPAAERLRANSEVAAKNTLQSTSLSADFEGGFAPNAMKISDTHWVLNFEHKSEYMFLFRLTGVKGKTVRMDLNGIPLEKWSTLNPVMAYDPQQVSLSQGANADQSLTRLQTVYGNNGTSFPSDPGYGWQYIPDVWSEGNGSLSFVCTFAQNSAVLAMKFPFTVKDYEIIIDQVKNNPNVRITSAGKSREGRNLYVLTVTDGGPTVSKPTVLIYAREHPNEHDNSWVATGALAFLMSSSPDADAIRRQFNFIVIPLLDPDGAAKELHENIINSFSASSSVESLAYGKWFEDWIANQNRIDVVLNLHNIESAEGPHILCPFFEPKTGRYTRCEAFNKFILDEFMLKGYETNPHPWAANYSNSRLGGWLCEYFGALQVPYEVNSQQSNRHLSLDELLQMGRLLVLGSAHFLSSEGGHELFNEITQSEADRRNRITKFGNLFKEQNIFYQEQGSKREENVEREKVNYAKSLQG